MTVPRCQDCPEHGCASGRCLAAYAPNQKAMSDVLDVIEPSRVSLTVVTMDVPLEQPCTGGYLCDCKACMREKVRPIKQVKQPWQVARAA